MLGGVVQVGLGVKDNVAVVDCPAVNVTDDGDTLHGPTIPVHPDVSAYVAVAFPKLCTVNGAVAATPTSTPIAWPSGVTWTVYVGGGLDVIASVLDTRSPFTVPRTTTAPVPGVSDTLYVTVTCVGFKIMAAKLADILQLVMIPLGVQEIEVIDFPLTNGVSEKLITRVNPVAPEATETGDGLHGEMLAAPLTH